MNTYSNEHYNKINFIDHIVWINLDRSTKRRQLMERELSHIKYISNTRIQGIDGNDDVDKYISHNNSTVTKYELACTLSHLKAINYLKMLDGKYFMILEDDISFEYMKYIPHDLEKIIKECPPFDILQLHKITRNANIANTWNNMWGAACYIISKDGVNLITKQFEFKDNILQNTTLPLFPADKLVYHYCNSYTYKYNIITTLDNDSTIHSSHIALHRTSNAFEKQRILQDFCES